MSTLGIIAEFNPFHNGHKYLIEKAKEITGANDVIIVMSGNYVQRGEPAIFDKYSRAYEAVNNGASVVFELPVCYATASAELFATASISFFNKLNCIDFICFGCETNKIEYLSHIADILCDEPDEFKNALKDFLASGYSYPVARKKALELLINNSEIIDIIDSPNNILAIEYLKALKLTKSTMKPVPIKRTDNGYHSKKAVDDLASASAIRDMIKNKDYSIKKYIPEYKHCYSNFSRPIFFNDFSNLLAPALLQFSSFDNYYDITEFLSNRISNLSCDYTNLSSFVDKLHSKNETKTHLSRSLLHILLNITDKKMQYLTNNEITLFANPLAFRKDSSIMQQIKRSSKLEIINKFGEYYGKQTGTTKALLDINIYADKLYNYIYKTKYNINICDDFSINNKNKIL